MLGGQPRIEDPPPFQVHLFAILSKFSSSTHPHSVVLVLSYLVTVLQWTGFSGSSLFSTSSLITSSLRFTHLYHFFASTPSQVYTGLIISFFTIVIFVVGLFLASGDQILYPTAVRFIRYIATFHHTFLALPLVGASLTPFICSKSDSCTVPFAIILIGFFLAIIQSLLAITFSLSCFDQNIRSVRSFSAITARFFFYCLVSRLASLSLVELDLFIPLRSAFFITALSLFPLGILVLQQPFIHFKTNKYLSVLYSFPFPLLVSALFSLPLYLYPIFLGPLIALSIFVSSKRINRNWLSFSPEAYVSPSPDTEPPAIEAIKSWSPISVADVSIAVRSLFTTAPAKALTSWNIIFSTSRKQFPSSPLPIFLQSSILFSFPHDHHTSLAIAKPLLRYSPLDVRFMASRLVEQCQRFGRGLQTATSGSATDLRIASKALELTRSRAQAVFASLINVHLGGAEEQQKLLQSVLVAARQLSQQSKQTDSAFLKALEKFPNDRDLLGEYARFLDDILADESRADAMWERFDDLNDELMAQKEHEKIKNRSKRRGSVSGDSATEGTGTKSGTNTGTGSEEDRAASLDDESRLAQLLGVSSGQQNYELCTVVEGEESCGSDTNQSDSKVIKSSHSSTKFTNSLSIDTSKKETTQSTEQSTPPTTPNTQRTPITPRRASSWNINSFKRGVSDNSLKLTDLLGYSVSSFDAPVNTLMLKDEVIQGNQESNTGRRLVVKRKQHKQAQELKQKKKEEIPRNTPTPNNISESVSLNRKPSNLEDAINKVMNKKKKVHSVNSSSFKFKSFDSDDPSSISVAEVDSESARSDVEVPEFTVPGVSIKKLGATSSESSSEAKGVKFDTGVVDQVPSSESTEVDEPLSTERSENLSVIKSGSSEGTTTRSNSVKFKSTSYDTTRGTTTQHYDESVGSTLSSGKAPRGWSHVDVKSVTMGTTADVPEDMRSQSTAYRNQRKRRRRKLHRGRTSLKAKSASRRFSMMAFAVVSIGFLLAFVVYLSHHFYINSLMDKVVASVYPSFIATSTTSIARSVRYIRRDFSNAQNVFGLDGLLEMAINDLDTLSKQLYVDKLSSKVGKLRDLSTVIPSSQSLSFSNTRQSPPFPVFGSNVYSTTISLITSILTEAKSALSKLLSNDFDQVESEAAFLTQNAISVFSRSFLDSTIFISDLRVFNSLFLLIIISSIFFSLVFLVWSFVYVLLPALSLTSQQLSRWLHLFLLLPGEALHLLAGSEQHSKIDPFPETVDSGHTPAVSGSTVSLSSARLSSSNLPSEGSSSAGESKSSSLIKSLGLILKGLFVVLLIGIVVVLVVLPLESIPAFSADQSLLYSADLSKSWLTNSLAQLDSAWGFGGQSLSCFSRFWTLRVNNHPSLTRSAIKLTGLGQSDGLGNSALSNVRESTRLLLELDYLQLISIKLSSLGNGFPSELIGSVYDFEYFKDDTSAVYDGSEADTVKSNVEKRRISRKAISNQRVFDLLDRLEDYLESLHNEVFRRFNQIYDNILSRISNLRLLLIVFSISAFFCLFFVLLISKIQKNSRKRFGLSTILFGLVFSIVVSSAFLVVLIVDNHQQSIINQAELIKNDYDLSLPIFKYLFFSKFFVQHPSNRAIDLFLEQRSIIFERSENLSPEQFKKFQKIDKIFIQMTALVSSSLTNPQNQFSNVTWNYLDSSKFFSDHVHFGLPRVPNPADPQSGESGRCWLTNSDDDFEMVTDQKLRVSLCILTDRQVIELISDLTSSFLIDEFLDFDSDSFLFHAKSVSFIGIIALIGFLFFYFSKESLTINFNSPNLVPKNTIKCGSLNRTFISSMSGLSSYPDLSNLFSLKNQLAVLVIACSSVVLVSPLVMLFSESFSASISPLVIHRSTLASLRSCYAGRLFEELELSVDPVITHDYLTPFGPKIGLETVAYAESALDFVNKLSTAHDALLFGSSKISSSVGEYPSADALSFGFPLPNQLALNSVFVNSDLTDLVLNGGAGALFPLNSSAGSVANLPLRGTWFHRSVDVTLRYYVDRARQVSYLGGAGNITLPEGMASLTQSVESATMVASATLVESIMEAADFSKSLMLAVFLVQIVLFLVIYFKGFRGIVRQVHIEESTLHQLLLFVPSELVSTCQPFENELIS
ncbi:hypothetical protein P9112_004289 [Eukaryota sp. TZLM1-RC]